MTVIGYNADAESYAACCGIEVDPDGLTAWLNIVEGTREMEVNLNYQELCALQRLVNTIVAKIAWNTATWLALSISTSKKYHLLRKQGYEQAKKTACGIAIDVPGELLSLVPIEKPYAYTCLKCMDIYHKEQEQNV